MLTQLNFLIKETKHEFGNENTVLGDPAFCYSILCAPRRAISILNMETGSQWFPPLATREDFLKIDAHTRPHPTI